MAAGRQTGPAAMRALVAKATASPCDGLLQYARPVDCQPQDEPARITAPFLSINVADDLLDPVVDLDLPRAPSMQALLATDLRNLTATIR